MTTLTKSPISVSQIAESSILSSDGGGGGASARTCGDVVLAVVAVAGCCCCWSTASGETEGEDEVEDVEDVPVDEEEEEPDEGEDDDEEDVIEEDNVVAVEGKICTISIGAWPCSSSSGLQLGVRSGVLVTNVAVEAASGGRALSIELNSVASVSCC